MKLKPGEIVLILVAAAVVGYIGYKVYEANKEENKK